MKEVMKARDRGTWKLQALHENKEIVGCQWVFAVKYHPGGNIGRLKAHLVAKGFT